MANFENPQVELIEAIGSWGFDPSYRGPQNAYPTGNDICILPNSKEACPITATRPLTVMDGREEDYQVLPHEPRVVGCIEELSDGQRLVFSKYGPLSLISGLEIFPMDYLDNLQTVIAGLNI